MPGALARAWLAEALDARWAGRKQLLTQYRGSEFLGDGTVLVPLDDEGHCIVFFVEFRMALVVIQFAGQKRGNIMKRRRTAVLS